MYCRNCGKLLSDDTKFCDSCGTKTDTQLDSEYVDSINRESSTHFINYSDLFQVTLQGISDDLSTANGSYDPIDLGEINADRLYEVFQNIKHCKMPDRKSENDDICPPSVNVITKDDVIHAFEMIGGEILYSNTNTVVSEKDAIKAILGERTSSTKTKTSKGKDGTVYKNPLQWGSDHRDIVGLTPVRKEDIPPTDRINTDSSVIDTKNTPQIIDRVIKSSTSKSLYKAPIAISIFAIIMSFGGFAVSEMGLGFVSFLVVILMIFLSIVLKKKSRCTFKLGFDWKYNVIWAMLENQKTPHYLGNANCIVNLSIEKDKLSRSRVASLGSTDAKMITSYRDDTKIWELIVTKTDGSKISLFTFFSKSDAERVLEKANDLLNRQI